MEPRLNVIALAVDDLDRGLVFYRDGLDLQTKGVVATDLVDEKTGAAGAIVIFKLESGLILTLYPVANSPRTRQYSPASRRAENSASVNWSRAAPTSTGFSNRRLPPARS